MGIFHEMYGVYFRIAARLLERESLTDREVQHIIRREGFRESVLLLPQKLLPQKDGSDWGLLRRREDGRLTPVTRHRPPRLVTRLQKRWLRTILDDARMGLFLSDAQIASLRQKLRDVPPLYAPGTFRYTDQFSDGDDYNDRHYAAHFRQILRAVWEQEILDISYRSGKGNGLRVRCVPFRIEYSEKNDKLRVYCIRLAGNRPRGTLLLNIGRILSLSRTGQFWEEHIPVGDYFKALRCKEPAVVCVHNERNAVERFLMEFAPYERQTERETGSGGCTVRIWYDVQDETELLIRLLSFGPVLEIQGPASLRQKAADRVTRQYALLHPEEHGEM